MQKLRLCLRNLSICRFCLHCGLPTNLPRWKENYKPYFLSFFKRGECTETLRSRIRELEAEGKKLTMDLKVKEEQIRELELKVQVRSGLGRSHHGAPSVPCCAPVWNSSSTPSLYASLSKGKGIQSCLLSDGARL